MNVKYGIITKQTLTTLENQLIYFLGKKALRNRDINDVVFLFNKTIKNIISNYIPHETVTFDDRDPPWINKNVKQLILERKMKCIKSILIKAKTVKYLTKLNVLQNKLNSIIESNKQNSYSRLSKNWLIQ